MTTQPPPAGWYPNPSGKPGQMYWDGQRWVPPAGPPQNPVPASLRRRWTSLRTRTKIAAVAAVVGMMAFTLWVSIGIIDSVFGSSSPAAQSSSGHNPFPGGNNTTCNPAWTCDGGSSAPHSAPSHGAAPNTATLSPYQQRQLPLSDEVCDAVGPDKTGGVLGDFPSNMALGSLMMGIKDATGWTDDQAIQWMKQVVSKQCPEFLNKFDK